MLCGGEGSSLVEGGRKSVGVRQGISSDCTVKKDIMLDVDAAMTMWKVNKLWLYNGRYSSV